MKGIVKKHGIKISAALALLIITVIFLMRYPALTKTDDVLQAAEVVFDEEEIVPLSGAPDTEKEAEALLSSSAALTTDAVVEASGERT